MRSALGLAHVGQALLAVSEVVFDMAALVSRQVEGLVLDLPVGASAPDEFPRCCQHQASGRR